MNSTSITTHRVYLGLGRDNGPNVSYEECEGFLAQHVSPYLTSYTRYHGIGCYKSMEEPCMIIEVIESHGVIMFYYDDLRGIADEWKKLFHQNCVLYTATPGYSVMM